MVAEPEVLGDVSQPELCDSQPVVNTHPTSWPYSGGFCVQTIHSPSTLLVWIVFTSLEFLFLE